MTFTVDQSKLRQVYPVYQKRNIFVRIFMGFLVALILALLVAGVFSILIGVFAWLFIFPLAFISSYCGILFGKGKKVKS